MDPALREMLDTPVLTWNTDVNAPCCPGEIVHADGRTILIQTDWDYPGVAGTFGWSPAHVHNYEIDQLDPRFDCEHNGTDGTIDCDDCGLTASDFISAAYAWLRENNGATADDPGYFDAGGE
ncbi:hypothetical protein LCGC14_1893990 [marine sediment metagenome]|uniref:Uncharacterized protein n=1 Tax=marine sediment metagenome TaxID=412755 RepID=A0A0F9FYL3_9ZZZZ